MLYAQMRHEATPEAHASGYVTVHKTKEREVKWSIVKCKPKKDSEQKALSKQHICFWECTAKAAWPMSALTYPKSCG
jgi:hypothetical protein